MYARRQQRYAMPRNKIFIHALSFILHFFNRLFPCHFSFGLGLLARCPCSICCLSFPIVPGSRVTIPVTPVGFPLCYVASNRPRWRWRGLQLPARNSHLSHTLVVCADDEIDEEIKEKSQDALLAFGHVLRKSWALTVGKPHMAAE
ncbi:hypothetical protein GGI35DRAFT_363717 [Trichoderma velutinum]